METFLLKAILDELKSQESMKIDLWNTDDISKYLRLSKSSVQSRIICRKDFPRAIRLPTSNGPGGRRWYAREVRLWVAKNREPLNLH